MLPDGVEVYCWFSNLYKLVGTCIIFFIKFQSCTICVQVVKMTWSVFKEQQELKLEK